MLGGNVTDLCEGNGEDSLTPYGVEPYFTRMQGINHERPRERDS